MENQAAHPGGGKNTSPEFEAVYGLFLSIACVLVSLRCYVRALVVRALVVKKLWWKDFSLLLGLVRPPRTFHFGALTAISCSVLPRLALLLLEYILGLATYLLYVAQADNLYLKAGIGSATSCNTGFCGQPGMEKSDVYHHSSDMASHVSLYKTTIPFFPRITPPLFIYFFLFFQISISKKRANTFFTPHNPSSKSQNLLYLESQRQSKFAAKNLPQILNPAPPSCSNPASTLWQ